MAIRTNQMYNFKGDPYVTQPDLIAAIQEVTSGSMAVKPFLFDESSMTQNGNDKEIVIDGIVFNMFNNNTGLIYCDLDYLTGANAGKTKVTFKDYADMDFGSNSVFTAMAFVKSDGDLIQMLEPGDYRS